MTMQSDACDRRLYPDPSRPRWLDSLIKYLRRRRSLLLKSLIYQLPRPLTILDVGGSQFFWVTNMNFSEEKDITIVLLNIDPKELEGLPDRMFLGVVGDARTMPQFVDKQFDVVVSNSVIEHVGSYGEQRRMATEIRRVAKRYFVQTPNRRFPIEPHFIFPCFQFLPFWVKVWLLSHVKLIGWGKESWGGAIETVNSIRLLSKKELMDLFPGATIAGEKYFGLVKSFMVYDWSG